MNSLVTTIRRPNRQPLTRTSRSPNREGCTPTFKFFPNVSRTPQKASEIPTVLATDNRSPGTQKWANKTVKKGAVFIRMVEREAFVNWVPTFNEIICNRKIVDKYSSGTNSPRLIAIGIRWMMAQAPMASRAKRNRAAARASGGMSCNPILI